MLNCEEATRLMSERQERTLSLGEKATLRIHVAMCSGCREFGRQMITIRSLIHRQDGNANKK